MHPFYPIMFLLQLGAECQPCELGCQAPRPAGCNHKCPKPCHQAPCPPCRMMIRMRCHCQTLLKHVECSQWVAASAQLRETLQSCSQPCPKEVRTGLRSRKKKSLCKLFPLCQTHTSGGRKSFRV